MNDVLNSNICNYDTVLHIFNYKIGIGIANIDFKP